jgi:hypothetical protein
MQRAVLLADPRQHPADGRANRGRVCVLHAERRGKHAAAAPACMRGGCAFTPPATRAQIEEHVFAGHASFNFGWCAACRSMRGHGDRPARARRFLTSFELLCFFVFAVAERALTGQAPFAHAAPLKKHVVVSVAMTLSRGLTNVSLQYLNYPTQVRALQCETVAASIDFLPLRTCTDHIQVDEAANRDGGWSVLHGQAPLHVRVRHCTVPGPEVCASAPWPRTRLIVSAPLHTPAPLALRSASLMGLGDVEVHPRFSVAGALHAQKRWR